MVEVHARELSKLYSLFRLELSYSLDILPRIRRADANKQGSSKELLYVHGALASY